MSLQTSFYTANPCLDFRLDVICLSVNLVAVRISELNWSFGNQFRLFILGFSRKEFFLSHVIYVQGDTVMFNGVKDRKTRPRVG